MIRHGVALAITCGLLTSAATDTVRAQTVEQFYNRM